MQYYHNTETSLVHPSTRHLIFNIPAEESRPGLNSSSHAGGKEREERGEGGEGAGEVRRGMLSFTVDCSGL